MGSAEGSPTLSYVHGGEIGSEAEFSSLARFLAKGILMKLIWTLCLLLSESGG